MNHFYFDPAWLKKQEYPSGWGEIIVAIVGIIFAIAVIGFFFWWLGGWALIFMWPLIPVLLCFTK